MSTVLIREREHTSTRLAPAIRSRPVASRAPSRSRRRRRSALGVWLVKVVLLGFVGLLSYGTSTLVGQTLMEQQRREGLRAQERAQQSRADAALLRTRVARLTSLKTIDDWAAMRGFSQRGGAVVAEKEPIRVATLR